MSEINNAFIEASRRGIRFTSKRGSLTTEDLWNLSLTELDTIAQNLHKQVEQEPEKSFIKKRTVVSKDSKVAFEVVLHIINTKLSEEEKKEEAIVKKQKKEKLLALIDSKENEALSSKSIEELKAELAGID
jgi:hypothetical protein